MSRLIISNAHIPSIKDESRKIVYKVADTNIFAYNKLNINNINHYSKSTDWIVGVGSYIYKHSTGGEALEKILQDFTEESIHVLKQQIKGIYTLAIYKNGVICCFNDYYGLYDTYYGNNDDFYYISTNIADILPFFKTIEINEYPFMLHCFGNGNFSSDGITIPKSWITIEAVIYGVILIANIEKFEKAPPDTISINPTNVDELSPINLLNDTTLTPGTVI